MEDLAALLATQRGAVSAAQLRVAGVSPSTAADRVAAGRWQRPFRGAYLIPPYADPADALRAAAALATAGRVAGVSAARWWSLDGAPEEHVPEVVVPHEHRRRVAGVAVRRTRHPECGGELVTSPARTLLDLVPRVRRQRLVVMSADAVRRGLVDAAALARAAAAGPRSHADELRELLARLDPRHESELERRFFDLLRAANLPRPLPQYRIDLGDAACYLDAAWPWARAGVQLDGLRWHGDATAFRADRRLDRRLAARGWVVVRVTAVDLSDRPRELVADLAALLERRWGPGGRLTTRAPTAGNRIGYAQVLRAERMYGRMASW